MLSLSTLAGLGVATALLLSSLTSTPTKAHPDQPTNCRHQDPDMLNPINGNQPQGCGQTVAAATAVPGRSPSKTPPTLGTTTVALTPEPPVEVGDLKSTIRREAMELYRDTDDLQARIVKEFNLKLPSMPTPCFYTERSKDNKKQQGGNQLGAELRSDYATMEKYSNYFAQRQPQMSIYESMLVGMRGLRENVGLLVNALNATADSMTEESVKAFGKNCLGTSYQQQAIMLLNLQVFLKEYLLQDIQAL